MGQTQGSEKTGEEGLSAMEMQTFEDREVSWVVVNGLTSRICPSEPGSNPGDILGSDLDCFQINYC